MGKFLVLAALILNTAITFAAELTLFDIPLRTASRGEIRSAITKAGGKIKSPSRDVDQYDATAIGLPGATQLEVIYLDNKLVMAQYSLSVDAKQEERVRKMLASKYGQPMSDSIFDVRGGRGNFDSEYISDGKYRWAFDNDMELVFKKDLFPSAPKYLSYVNKQEEARLGRLVKDVDKRAAEKEAASKKSVF